MPPGGLWPIPRGRVYNSAVPRETFNAKDFANEKSSRADKAQSQDDPIEAPASQGKDKRRKKHKDKHKRDKWRHDSAIPRKSTSTSSSTDDTAHTDSAAATRKSPREPSHGTPTRKRGRHKDKRSSAGFGGSFIIGEKLAKDVQSALGGVGAQFVQDVGLGKDEMPRKKKARSSSTEVFTSDNDKGHDEQSEIKDDEVGSVLIPYVQIKREGSYIMTPEVDSLDLFRAPSVDDPYQTPVLNRTSRASSTVTSLPSSSTSSVSIPEHFNRVGAPYVQSGAGTSPFDERERRKKDKIRLEDEEAPSKIFNERFSDLQSTINFDFELGYLHEYFQWQEDKDTEIGLPCLGQASGCTPKKENILRLRREGHEIKTLEPSVSEQKILQDAVQRGQRAVNFLSMAVQAQVPVPTGRLDGTWTLHCPEYSVHHFDRYEYGLRTLTISSVAGFEDSSAYTARLSIPPRPMAYLIVSFTAPPHASFRLTTLMTVTEGYKMEVIFLGNGILHLRLDLNLLLRGKPTEMVGGKQVWMEFVGIHEKALRLEDAKDELEEEGKKLFAKYGGVHEE